MISVTRRLEVDAGHRLVRHEGRCQNVHGHRYAFEVTVAPVLGLDALSRVVDFGVLKSTVGGWLDKWWDHAYLAQREDEVAALAEREGLKVYWLDDPPTAETLAAHLFGIARALLPEHLNLISVRCYETPNCWAEAREAP